MFKSFWTIYILQSLINVIYGQGWMEPYFKDPNSIGIVFKNIPNRQAIEMEEELPLPIKLAVINYKGIGKPTIGSFKIGSNKNLNLTIANTNNEWVLFINMRQDYENPVQQKYEFDIGIDGDASIINTATIFILTINIFDNNPSITYEGPCKAPELHAGYNTKCIFTVIDLDGMEGNDIKLKIEGNHNEDKLFEFKDQKLLDAYSLQYTLYVKKELRYEERVLYNFYTKVFDIAGNNGSVITILEVTDEPSLDPIWVIPFATARFPEKQPQIFEVKAIDGDTGINKPICYKLAFLSNQNYAELISIDRATGIISISPINRDALQQEVFPFTVIAFKCDNETWAIIGDAVLIVDDINDNYPEITTKPSIIKILEATYLTLPLDIFNVNDIDLGRHATYYILLASPNNNIAYAQPFAVIPNKGYQNSNFTITVSNTTFLDYEDNNWRTFQLMIIATEEDFQEHNRQLKFTIELINWNDELPIFNATEYSISVLETISENQILTKIMATDRDIGDSVIHSIVGSIDLHITIDGEISTKINDTFDYERQTSVMVQIKATDTLQTYENEKLNVAFAQLTINVIDVNDETPDIRMPRTSPTIVENSPGKTVVTNGILATDPDGTAKLLFKIDWNASYATKSGQVAEKKFYENCFIIEANTTNNNKVVGTLIVNPHFELLIDYEEYEVIYLTISVTDLNQEVNDDSAEAVLTIRIEDENDNKPQFILDTLKTERSVVEEALAGNLIGTIFAIDIDGPQFNKITYSISPELDTPLDLVEINANNGAIIVKENAIIDCDNPRIDNLSYVVTLYDGYWITNGTIQIKVIDINNKWPFFKHFNDVVELYENITMGNIIQTIPTMDLDRDSPHNVIQYTINFIQFPNLMKYFEIDTLTGIVKVKLQSGAVLDRDHGESEHDIYINIEDNYQGNGRTNTNITKIKLILLDVNDNAPQMPTPDSFKPIISENIEMNSIIETRFYAPDIDDENTPNAWVGYRILSIMPGINTANPLPNAENIFKIVNYDKKYARIETAKHLKGFYGTWLITIEAFDHGHEWTSQIQQRSKEMYEFTIEPFNFNAPTLINPRNGQTYRLSFDDQRVGKPLLLTDKTIIPPFEAIDTDGGVFGNITFEITNYGSGNDIDHFEIIKITNKQSQIYLKQDIEAKFYQFNIRAIDGGGKYSDWATNIILIFINLAGEPYFNNPVFDTAFTENTTGLTEWQIIPEAEDPKNFGIENDDEKFEIFYFIDIVYRPNDARLFNLNATNRILKIQTELDRESIDNHEIRIIATNHKNGPINPKDSSMLVVNIMVIDVNDNPPKFERENYGSGITDKDYTGKEVLIVKANDPDLDDEIRYFIVENSLKAIGENLNDVIKNPFTLDVTTGVLKLNFAVQPSMKGYIEFKVQALDLVDHMDECGVKIFIISESSRVTFVFLNSKESIEQQTPYLLKIFNEFYHYECNIDDILKAEIDGITQETTNVRVHFINNNEAIEASEILSRSNDIIFISNLRATLLNESINLLDVPDNSYAPIETNTQQIIQIMLSITSTVFGILLLAMIFTYFTKIRNLKRQLKALSTTEFGSNSSDLNRQKAPTTNVFSIEGSNPVLNDNELTKGVFDTLSVTSSSTDDSDFTGIDTDPTFALNGKRDSTNIAIVNSVHKRNSPLSTNTLNEMIENEKRDSDFGTHRF